MAHEIEAKFKVPNFTAVRRALKEMAAVYRGTAIQRDTFFDTANRSFYNTDRGLRLRQVRVVKKGEDGLDTDPLLTFKGPRKKNSRTKIRRETQTHVDKAEALREILTSAGLSQFMQIEKRRASYKVRGALIELDELPVLGFFVEIEAASEKTIDQVRRKLNLPDEPITESYVAMVAAKCNRVGSECMDITFANCGRCLR